MAVVLLTLALAGAAQAVSYSQAYGDAVAQSAQDCPHHRLGKCLRRSIYNIYGLGGGKWHVDVRGWEGSIFDPTNDWHHARWVYGHKYVILTNGAHSSDTAYGDW